MIIIGVNMTKKGYQSLDVSGSMGRRDFLKAGTVASAGLVLGNPAIWARNRQNQTERIKTNVSDVLKIPRTVHSLPGPFPGKVVEVHDPSATTDDKPVPESVNAMFDKGLNALTGKSPRDAFSLFFTPDDVIGIKVNPVGAGLISTHLEVVDSIIDWLVSCGMQRQNIIIWDRFDYMLDDAGFTPERYPGVAIEGLQTMDEDAASGKKEDNSRWLKEDGTHVSVNNFDRDVFYWADIEGPKDMPYLNQHVFNGKHSYFGKLVTQKLTKIINVPVFKNTGNGVSMATKNLGYGAVCNTNRLHKPLFFDVNVEVMAFPTLRDKVVLNITDGLRGQYDGGPSAAPQFAYTHNRLYFATDAFASDRICHDQIIAKRKETGITVNEHPRFTEYFRYAEKLGLGVGDPQKINHIVV